MPPEGREGWIIATRGDGGASPSLVGARLRVSSACDHVLTFAPRRCRREHYHAVQCGHLQAHVSDLGVGLERTFSSTIGETSGLHPRVSWASDGWIGCVRFIEARLSEGLSRCLC